MITNVGELIRALEKFEPETPVGVRGDYASDRNLLMPFEIDMDYILVGITGSCQGKDAYENGEAYDYDNDMEWGITFKASSEIPFRYALVDDDGNVIELDEYEV